MKLLSEEMNKRWTLYNEFELNKEFIKSIWMFYSLYDLSLALCGIEDQNYRTKNQLIFKYLVSSDSRIYNKIKKLMIKDVKTINLAMKKLENFEEQGVFIGDYKKPTMFAININE